MAPPGISKTTVALSLANSPNYAVSVCILCISFSIIVARLRRRDDGARMAQYPNQIKCFSCGMRYHHEVALLYTHMHAHEHTNTRAREHTNAHTRTHIQTHTHTHTQTHTHRSHITQHTNCTCVQNASGGYRLRAPNYCACYLRPRARVIFQDSTPTSLSLREQMHRPHESALESKEEECV